MELNEQQYERIGRYLDGEPVELSADELTVAQQIRTQEASLGFVLDAALPKAAADRARRRLRVQVLRRRRRVWTIGNTAIAAAAATVLIASALWFQFPSDSPPAAGRSAGKLVRLELPAVPQTQTEVEIDMLAEELNELTEGIRIVSAETCEDGELESLEWEVDHFWLEELESFELQSLRF